MTEWGWTSDRAPGSVTWVPGTLEDSYKRVAAHGGQWRLASAVPISEYYRVLAETRKANHNG
jgi:hypothetical protein